MELTAKDMALVRALSDGLALSERPYADLAVAVGWSEEAVINRLRDLIEAGIIRRFGVVVRHRELGFGANAMVVWDVPDDQVAEAGRRLAEAEPVTLCYRRPRREGRHWPYNLFCMLHGRDRSQVEALVAELALRHPYPHKILFSTRRFKQCGAQYGKVA
ncbi:MAG TPA: AsnC family transcriptional regulator [Candidatus Sulfotelmatobacter sp.]|jgi:DNA-binding Lrp family transcriptional regulator|nr:AsnC family transcriptional regulator [Candidatus Sulfotelmatobacter sp.]